MAQNPTISKMETTQTAVDWLIDNLKQFKLGKGRWNYDWENSTYVESILEQAKQMEKQQLANAWDKACDQYIYRDGNLVKVWKDFDKYYNDNYGSNNKI